MAIFKCAAPGTKEGKTSVRVMAMAKQPPSDSLSFSAIPKHLWLQGSDPGALGPFCNPPPPLTCFLACCLVFHPIEGPKRQCVPWGGPGSLRQFSFPQTCCVPRGRLLASLSLNVPDGLAQRVLRGHVAHRGGEHAGRLPPALLAVSASSGRFLDLPGPPF